MATVSAAFAGCLGAGTDEGIIPEPDDPATVTDPWPAVLAAMEGVPCEATVPSGATSENLKQLGLWGSNESAFANLDPWGEFLVAGNGLGLHVISVRDPMNPVEVAWYPDHGFGDAKWTANGTAVAAASRGRTIDILDVSAVYDWNGGEPLGNDSIRVVGTWEYEGAPPPPRDLFTNMHMLEAHRINGNDYVFVAPNDDTGVSWFKVTIEDGNATFDTMPPVGAPLSGGPLGPHDMTVEDDLILNKPMMYIPNGFEGWQAYDLSDPERPVRLASMPNLVMQGYTHTIVGNKVGEKRIVATIQEVGTNTLKVYDATNFASPVLLAEWSADKSDPKTPQHDITLLDGKLYMAHYTYGVYVFDLTTLTTPLVGTATLSPVAHFVPANRMDGGALGFANVFDVNVVSGVLYISDFTDPANALTSVGFGCLTPGDPLLTGA